MASIDMDAFAADWIAAWNSHDLNRIIAHYGSDIVFLSPIAEKLMGNGKVAGLDRLRRYWTAGLASQTDLKFELLHVLRGHECLTILYRNHKQQIVAETLEFDGDGKIQRAFACYQLEQG
ncbi:nuclear transport factor 2 family protein [Sneathiella marina]|uniref:Nuclear transport factor 2 family protein n=1 Tax=Sneathiella marina TaxID=2950108 RepID=A0ABY4W121_9PROT|nr:nuclear transport factor 2 family protein [Sneathiella marina]USG60556.1 nuclear transport factor 2 family protein [Sneathiella marina]